MDYDIDKKNKGGKENERKEIWDEAKGFQHRDPANERTKEGRGRPSRQIP